MTEPMTLDLDAFRREAEEGLAIAERATNEPWVHRRDCGGRGVDETADNVGSDKFIVDEGANGHRADLEFIADARTRAPNAYRAVSRLCDDLQESERRLTEALADAEHLREELERYRSIFGDAPDSVG